MNQLQIIEQNNQRVLTTAQLAESYGTDNKMISYNFNYNKERYKEGKHYFSLTGNEKRDFINHHEIQDGSKNAQTLYLWTEKGAWLHAKSLNTDEAWDAYEMLVDEYYDIKEELQGPINSTIALLETALKHEKELTEIKTDVNYLKGNMRVDYLQQQDLQANAKSAVVRALGGLESPAYKNISGRVFSAFWKEFKQHFKVPRYPDLPRIKYDEAINFIEVWRPSTSLQIEIDNENRQMEWV